MNKERTMFEYVHHVAYTVADMEHAVRVFRDTFGLEMVDRRVVTRPVRFEMATFRCGPTLIELQRPIDYPELEQFLKDRGPGLNHVAFAVKGLPGKVVELEARGLAFKSPGAFTAGTGWTIANFDLAKCDLPYFASPYHDDHLAEAEKPQRRRDTETNA
jgi:methylmalonyl-CoA/ethylmalonyl-CoA epimerase